MEGIWKLWPLAPVTMFALWLFVEPGAAAEAATTPTISELFEKYPVDKYAYKTQGYTLFIEERWMHERYSPDLEGTKHFTERQPVIDDFDDDKLQLFYRIVSLVRPS